MISNRSSPSAVLEFDAAAATTSGCCDSCDFWFATALFSSACCDISSSCRVFTTAFSVFAAASFLGLPFLGFVLAKTINSSILVLSTPALCAREDNCRIAVLETPVFASTSLWEALKMRNIIRAAARFSSLYSIPRGMVDGGGGVEAERWISVSELDHEHVDGARLDNVIHCYR
jgi:hypothetical protein